MEEVLTRRFRNYLRERDEGAHAGKRFAYPPNLLLIDGGKGQLGVAVRVLEELGLEDICVASASPSGSKRCTCPGSREPVRIPRDSEALYLLQQVRDEAHRFAITYHRQLRDKKMTTSVLDDVARPRARPAGSGCCKEFGSVKKLRELDEDELARAPVAARRRSARPSTRTASRPRARRPRDDGEAMTLATPLDVTIITGMSGAGRSEAAHVLEDLGFFVIDNLPPMLIGKVAELARGTRDADRATRSSSTCAPATSSHDLVGRDRRAARATARTTRVLFLDAADDVLVRRYEASRRRHPLSDTDRVSDGIARERALLEAAQGRGRPRRRHVEPQRARAARPPARAVRRARRRRRAAGRTSCRSATSTACRSTSTSCSTAASCPNPHWVDELRPLTGLDAPVRDYVLAQPGRERVPRRARPPVRAALPGYEREGKAYLSIGVGCTGGRHRSVVDRRAARRTAPRAHGYRAAVHHRDVDRDA